MSPDNAHRLHTPEELGFTFQLAGEQDLIKIEKFLTREDIDNLFSPPLSDPTRGISIKDRVTKKFNDGFWVISLDKNQSVIGCMAIVTAKIGEKPTEIKKETGVKISSGISLAQWGVGKIMELSTVATDPTTKKEFSVKGIGENLLFKAIEQIKIQGKNKWGLITDSWLGGDMDGFITHVVNKARIKPTKDVIDPLIRIYSDPLKRGPDGPLTTEYIIPCNLKDWSFLIAKQSEINKLRQQYQNLQTKNNRS